MGTLDDNNLGTGSSATGGGAANSADEGDALFNAEIFPRPPGQRWPPAPANYQLTVWQSPDSQDIIQASTAAIP